MKKLFILTVVFASFTSSVPLAEAYFKSQIHNRAYASTTNVPQDWPTWIGGIRKTMFMKQVNKTVAPSEKYKYGNKDWPTWVGKIQ